jgi:hypothetical protein
MRTKRRRRRSPEQIIAKMRDADAMLNAGKDLAVCDSPGLSDAGPAEVYSAFAGA